MDKLQVIIADDHEASRKVVFRFLETYPNLTIVGLVENGEELLQKVIKEEPHLIIVDIQMPLLNGMDAVKKCLAFLPQLKVIFITGYDEFAVEAFNVSAVDYIMKPIKQDRLYQGIEKTRQLLHQPNLKHLCMTQDPGKNIRILMAEKNMNTSELAYLTGLTQATVSNLRSGKVKKPNIETATLIAQALGVAISDIWKDINY